MTSVVDVAIKIMQLVISTATILTLIYTFATFVKSPRERMEQRLKELEAFMHRTQHRLEDGQEHFKMLDNSTAATQQALLAIMDALLSDNNKDELKKARNELYDYLTKNRNN